MIRVVNRKVVAGAGLVLVGVGFVGCFLPWATLGPLTLEGVRFGGNIPLSLAQLVASAIALTWALAADTDRSWRWAGWVTSLTAVATAPFLGEVSVNINEAGAFGGAGLYMVWVSVIGLIVVGGVILNARGFTTRKRPPA